MRVSKTLKHACQVLRSRVRFEKAVLRLSDNLSHDDTAAIREATRLYVETWIVPIIDYIERGDTAQLDKFTTGKRRCVMDSERNN